MGGFCSPPTTMTVPHNEDRGVGNTKPRIMISTDFAACSLDIPNVTQVINFDLPTTN